MTAQAEQAELELPTCAWYALCDNPAPYVVDHPVLGAVRVCRRCIDRNDLSGSVLACADGEGCDE